MMTEQKIGFLDLSMQHEKIKEEVFARFEEVYAKTAFSGGPFVEEFELAFAKYCNTEFAVGVNNGTTALHLAMIALGIGPEDEVILPANTFIASAWGPYHVGAKPVFVDCDSETWEIDPEKIEDKITNRTKAIIGVHLYGLPFDVDSVKAITEKHNLFLIEDAAQAHGALYKGEKTGGIADIGCFSFYPGKNLGACGEGGGITTNNKLYYDHLLRLRNHGSVEKYYHVEPGFNMRMGGLEGVSLSVKLKYIEYWNTRRKEIARMYQEGITNVKVKLQKQPDYADSVYHLFVVTTDSRDNFMKHLNDKNIWPGLHYPVPCHMQKAFSYLNYKKGDFPNSEFLADHCSSLPMYAELTDDQVGRVIDAVNSY